MKISSSIFSGNNKTGRAEVPVQPEVQTVSSYNGAGGQNESDVVELHSSYTVHSHSSPCPRAAADCSVGYREYPTILPFIQVNTNLIDCVDNLRLILVQFNF